MMTQKHATAVAHDLDGDRFDKPVPHKRRAAVGFVPSHKGDRYVVHVTHVADDAEAPAEFLPDAYTIA